MSFARYKILFSLFVYHSYYRDGISDNWQFVPDPLTQKVLKKYGFALNRLLNGFELAINLNVVENDILKYISQSTDLQAFRFKLLSEDSRIFMATEIPVNEVGKFKINTLDQLVTDGSQNIELKPVWEATPESESFGEISIDFSSLPNPVDNNDHPVFEIRFNGRSTQWKYYIMNKSKLDLNNVSVATKNGEALEGPKKVKIQNGESALEFNSGTDLIPLSEYPQTIFNLIDNDQNGNGLNAANIIYKGLPNPNPDQFNIVNFEADPIVSSPMYVYV